MGSKSSSRARSAPRRTVDLLALGLDLAVLVLAVVALVVGLRLPSLFPAGRVTLSLRFVGLAAAAAVVQASVELAGLLMESAELEALQDALQFVFLLLLSTGGVLFVRTWKAPALHPGPPAVPPMDETSALAQILAGLVAEFASTVGKPFTYAIVRRLAEPVVKGLPAVTRAAILSRLPKESVQALRESLARAEGDTPPKAKGGP